MWQVLSKLFSESWNMRIWKRCALYRPAYFEKNTNISILAHLYIFVYVYVCVYVYVSVYVPIGSEVYAYLGERAVINASLCFRALFVGM